MRLGYRGATFSEVAGAGEDRGKLLAVTFDDAFASVLSLARPILDRLGLTGTVFAVTSFADTGEPLRWPGVEHWAATEHAPELASMTWAQLRGLAADGWEVGSHSLTHPRLTSLGNEELARELSQSRARCSEAMGVECTAIAYPYGAVDPRVVAATLAAGYRHGAALPARWHGPRPLEHPRVGVYFPDGMGRFRIKVSPAGRRLRKFLPRPRRP